VKKEIATTPFMW